MQQNCAVHSRGVYWLALHYPHCPHEGQEQQGTQNGQTADCAPLLAAVVFMHSLFLPIRYAFLYRTCLPTSFHKNSLKSPFTYIGTKKAKNSHLKIKFFQKNLRAAETAPKREKSGYIIVSNCGRSVFPLPGSVQAADKQYTVLHCHRRSEDYKLRER